MTENETLNVTAMLAALNAAIAREDAAADKEQQVVDARRRLANAYRREKAIVEGLREADALREQLEQGNVAKRRELAGVEHLLGEKQKGLIEQDEAFERKHRQVEEITATKQQAVADKETELALWQAKVDALKAEYAMLLERFAKLGEVPQSQEERPGDQAGARAGLLAGVSASPPE